MTMSLVRSDPLQELEDTSSRVDRLFGRQNPAKGTRPLERSKETMALADWSPAVEIKEAPEAYRSRSRLRQSGRWV